MSSSSSSSSHDPNKGAYWPSWSSTFPPSNIDTSLFTHVYYAFLNFNKNTFMFEIDDQTSRSLTNFTNTLHKKNPLIKTMLSIGGYSFGNAPFAVMAADLGSRKTFINSSIDVARKFNFDGLDLDWEFPETQQDMINFRTLITEWRAAVEKEVSGKSKRQLFLSAATYYKPKIDFEGAARDYPVDSINKNLDWINVMCYDYRGWDRSKTGANASLYDPNGNVSTSNGLQSWIKARIQMEKLVMGLPLYGRTWTLRDPSVHGIGAPAVGYGPGNDGTMLYVEIENFNAQNKARVEFDEATVSTYSVSGKSWIGYDDRKSVKRKIEYARANNIGGYFFWSVNGDQNWTISRQASTTWEAPNP